jgi:hypothetical protein
MNRPVAEVMGFLVDNHGQDVLRELNSSAVQRVPFGFGHHNF